MRLGPYNKRSYESTQYETTQGRCDTISVGTLHHALTKAEASSQRKYNHEGHSVSFFWEGGLRHVGPSSQVVPLPSKTPVCAPAHHCPLRNVILAAPLVRRRRPVTHRAADSTSCFYRKASRRRQDGAPSPVSARKGMWRDTDTQAQLAHRMPLATAEPGHVTGRGQ